MNFVQIVTLIGCNVILLVFGETVLSPCDYQRFPSTGCEDELGAQCDQSISKCVCKPGNWVVFQRTFCFPEECKRGYYYDHNYKRCEQQRRATLNSNENYCKYDFHCQGDHINCHYNGWNRRCQCNKGFVYDVVSGECLQLKGLNGFCENDSDCRKYQYELVCRETTCQCDHGFTYNSDINGCEDNERIKERDSQTRTLIYIFIIMGVMFGVVLSLKFSSGASHSTAQFVLKSLVASQTTATCNTQDTRINNIRETA